VQSFAFFRAEKSFFVSETKLLGTEVKGGLGEVNEETLDPGIEKIRTGGKDQDKNNQVSPMHRHEQHLSEGFHCAHALIIADPLLTIKTKRLNLFILDGFQKKSKNVFFRHSGRSRNPVFLTRYKFPGPRFSPG
jgi:hypothetical protein